MSVLVVWASIDGESRPGNDYEAANRALKVIGLPTLEESWEHQLQLPPLKNYKANKRVVVDRLPDGHRRLKTTTKTGVVFDFSVSFKYNQKLTPPYHFFTPMDRRFDPDLPVDLGTGQHILYVAPKLHNPGDRTTNGRDSLKMRADFRAKYGGNEQMLMHWWQEYVRDLRLTVLLAKHEIPILHDPLLAGPPRVHPGHRQRAADAAWAKEHHFHIDIAPRRIGFASRRVGYSIVFQYSEALLFLNADVPRPARVIVQDYTIPIPM